jgi:peptidoglycan/LPS O-acetylase OafA/YrhL
MNRPALDLALDPSPTRKGSKEFRLGYRPALDGLRGVAILSVIFAHTQRTGAAGGPIGVDIFFVLSGFLITCLLVQERDQFDSISFRAFYARRALRLLPALLVLLFAVVTFYWLVGPRSSAIRTTVDALIALLYSTNWAFVFGFRQPAHVLTHTWSLSIEEQFYLTWPALLLLLLRFCRTRRSVLMWIALGLFLLLVEKVTILMVVPVNGLRWIDWATECRGEPLLVGCAMGIILSSGLVTLDVPVRQVIQGLAWCLAMPALLVLNLIDIPAQFSWIGLHLTIALGAAAIMFEALVTESGVIHKFLTQRWLVYIGGISYGLYLWHYPIFVLIQSLHWRLPAEFSAETALTAAATLASFYLLERPLLQFKQRFRARNRNYSKSTLPPGATGVGT